MAAIDYTRAASENLVRRDAYLNFAYAMFKKLAEDMDKGGSVNDYLTALNIDDKSKMYDILGAVGGKDGYNKHKDKELTMVFEFMKYDILGMLTEYIKFNGEHRNDNFIVKGGSKVFSPPEDIFQDAVKKYNGSIQKIAIYFGVHTTTISKHINRTKEEKNENENSRSK